jgi:hypothetical protein
MRFGELFDVLEFFYMSGVDTTGIDEGLQFLVVELGDHGGFHG